MSYRKIFLSGLIALMTLMTANAHDFEVDGIYYNKQSDNTLEVTCKNDNHLTMAYSGDIVIPEKVTYAGVTFSVTSIKELSFWNCTNVTSVTIPSSITSIGYRAFFNCSGMKTLYFNAVQCNDFNNYDHVFPYMITTVIVGNNVKTLPAYFLNYCQGLTSLTIGESVERIGASAFEGCNHISSIKLPPGVSEIGEGAFSNCRALEEINVPESVILLGDGAFSDCSILESITLPNSITNLPPFVFYGCRKLASVNLPEQFPTIGEKAFCYCNSLKEINFPSSLTSIGLYAFFECRNLTTLDIPDAVVTIDDYAFQNCSGLISVNIGNSVKSIGVGCFGVCNNLKTLTLGSSIEEIGRYAFSDCNSLENVYSYSVKPPTCLSGIFNDCDLSNSTLYIPSGTKDDYETSYGWQDFGYIIDNLSGIEDIENDETRNEPAVFYNLNGIKVGNLTDNLPRGIYIVKQGAKIFKISVK